jgi:N-acetylglucosaminyldiphosphoundecaprenol N-acetyl-beta-D-mannosaminyltransferase
MGTAELTPLVGGIEGREPARHTVKILGSQIDLVDADDAVSRVQGWIEARDGRCRQVVVTGFHGLWEAHRDAEFKGMVNSAALWLPDGIAPVWIARLQGERTACRVPGAEFMEAYLAKADMAGYRSFFYGDTERTLTALARVLQERYPGHRVAGVLSPPFRPLSPEEDEAQVRAINRARPDVLWVGMGMPKQDRWIYEHRDRLNVPVAVGVGAAFRFLAGHVRRAPNLVGRMGLEWAYRLLMEPRKCWRRCFIQGPQFVAHVAMELSGLRKYD